ncbi:hypothetical protein DDE05_04130 [Streptomyces cavourensis]|nr:hypothetical protein DDE05_04130 [Streptomyces cavourensis]
MAICDYALQVQVGDVIVLQNLGVPSILHAFCEHAPDLLVRGATVALVSTKVCSTQRILAYVYGPFLPTCLANGDENDFDTGFCNPAYRFRG